jgi:glycosyltransferase involved in cell wall biosynthesis
MARAPDRASRDNLGVPPLVAIDVRDAAAPQLRGWGRYAQCLVRALESGPGEGFELAPLTGNGRGPEVLFEQVGLPWLLRRKRADLVHATNCFLPLVRPCPGVVTINDLAFETWPSDFAPRTRLKYRTLARLAAHSAQRVICPSSYTAADVCTRYGIDSAKVTVIPDAPALALGDAPAPGGPYIIAVGDLRQKKNLASLVRAFVELRRGQGIPHRLVLAGVDGGESSRLHALAGSEPVELTGYVSDGALDALIRGADILVHPSLYEGFGLVVLEAMARGTPVLAARATVLPETGGEAAAYFDPGDDGGAEDLAVQLGSLLADPAALQAHVERGFDHVQQFTWERTARETAAVYRELL